MPLYPKEVGCLTSASEGLTLPLLRRFRNLPPAGTWGEPAPVRATPPGLAVDGSPLVEGVAILAPVTNRRWESGEVHKAVLDLIDVVGRAMGEE